MSIHQVIQIIALFFSGLALTFFTVGFFIVATSVFFSYNTKKSRLETLRRYNIPTPPKEY